MSNLEMMKQRLNWQGGNQEQRMIKDKHHTFLKTLQYSYQGCDVRLIQSYSQCEEIVDSLAHRALINPDKIKQSYDDKILSIDYGVFEVGDVFTWLGTNTQWIIYLQALTEDAYFRGEIRLCKYKIKFKNKDGHNRSTWAAIQGPSETAIQSNNLKKQISLDSPNLKLDILMPLNSETKEAFDRYSEFLFAGKCWRVQATDSISMKNILEVRAEEYYIDKEKDDVENEIKDGLVIEPVDPSPRTKIQGNSFILPKVAETYTIDIEDGEWSILEDNFPVCITPLTSTTVEITWMKTTSGQFTLQWYKGDTTETKVIVVESLF